MSNEQPTTNREKAVAVAKDVLKHVQTYRWIRGTYLAGTWYGGTPLTGDLQNHVEEVEKKCTMCLLGACLVSKARLFDDVSIDKMYKKYYVNDKLDYGVINPDRETIGPLLQDIFSLLELAKIESAFERRPLGAGCESTSETHEMLLGAAVFGMRIPDNVGRVTAVMENIIANNGTFVVDPATEVEYSDCAGAYL